MYLCPPPPFIFLNTRLDAIAEAGYALMMMKSHRLEPGEIDVDVD